VQQYPDADAQLKQLFRVMSDIEDAAGNTPASVGESGECATIVNAAEGNRASYYKPLHGKPLFGWPVRHFDIFTRVQGRAQDEHNSTPN
jgi:hypothetical protein